MSRRYWHSIRKSLAEVRRNNAKRQRKIVNARTAMRLRDLLTFNLFLQLTDGVVSYQAFALGAIEANPVVAAAILNWGMIWGLLYNKALACLLLLLIFALRRNRRLLARRHWRLRHRCTSAPFVFASGNCHARTRSTPLCQTLDSPVSIRMVRCSITERIHGQK